MSTVFCGCTLTTAFSPASQTPHDRLEDEIRPIPHPRDGICPCLHQHARIIISAHLCPLRLPAAARSLCYTTMRVGDPVSELRPVAPGVVRVKHKTTTPADAPPSNSSCTRPTSSNQYVTRGCSRPDQIRRCITFSLMAFLSASCLKIHHLRGAVHAGLLLLRHATLIFRYCVRALASCSTRTRAVATRLPLMLMEK